MDSEVGEDGAGAVEEPIAAGTQMRQAREAAGLGLDEIATRTRVPLRHLEALERGDYGALPGITYCAGFARAYARAVGLDEAALTAKVRREVDATGDFSDPYQIDEPIDPARVPPRALAWAAAVAAVLVVGGYAVWRMQVNAPPPAATQVAAPAAPRSSPRRAASVAKPAIGPVVLTAAEEVWLRVYEAGGRTLLERILAKGERFTLPADARSPLILTGRPDAVSITVGGRAIPPLGTAERTISDVPIDARSLLARLDPPSASPSGGGAAAGSNAATAR